MASSLIRGFVDPSDEDEHCPCIRPEMCDKCITPEELEIAMDAERQAAAEEESAAYKAAIRDLEATCAAANAEILERTAHGL